MPVTVPTLSNIDLILDAVGKLLKGLKQGGQRLFKKVNLQRSLWQQRVPEKMTSVSKTSLGIKP